MPEPPEPSQHRPPPPAPLRPEFAGERQVTSGTGGRILTNTGVWSPDGRWIVYDTRSDPEGALFDGERIEMVNVATGEVRCLFTARGGARCGVATFHPHKQQVAFILGPEHPTAGWSYGPSRRRGVLVDVARPDLALNLDARDLTPPFTPGALRGGSHVHIFSPDGEWVSFTYNDEVLSRFAEETPEHEVDLRGVGVSVPGIAVRVPKSHPRNHDGGFFSVLATRLTARPSPATDEICRAVEEGWVGTGGYRRADGTWQRRALAFQGHVVTRTGQSIAEVFVVDLPEDVTVPSPHGPLEGTPTRRPRPPLGTRQRRLTFTADRRYPGLQGPRHWLRSAPDGSKIAFLMRDDAGTAQLWTVSPNGGLPRQVTQNAFGVASAFTWSPDGHRIAYAADNSIFTVEVETGRSMRLTPRTGDADAPLPLACVFSPDGRLIAYQRRVPENAVPGASRSNQVFVVPVSAP